jgi:nicotinamide mononucleotide transporter
MHTHTDASLPWLDASLTGFSLIAQLWMAQKRVECWVLWLVVDVIYVGLFAYKNLYLTALLYLVFVGLAARGWFAWRREVKHA